jgi:F-type H+-transporting ATPase subunit epsilon
MAKAVSGQLQCLVVTPERQVVDVPADFVVLTAHDGQIGILPEHSALLSKLSPGLLRIDHGQTKQYFFVAGGFVEVLDNRITVLTPEALAVDKLDPKVIDSELAEAEKIPAAPEANGRKRRKALDLARGKRVTFNEAAAKK